MKQRGPNHRITAPELLLAGRGHQWTQKNLVAMEISHMCRQNCGRALREVRFFLFNLCWTVCVCVPWWPWLNWAGPPPRLPASHLPTPAGRVCPAAAAEPSYPSDCTWAWSHTSHHSLLSLGYWQEPRETERERGREGRRREREREKTFSDWYPAIITLRRVLFMPPSLVYWHKQRRHNNVPVCTFRYQTGTAEPEAWRFTFASNASFRDHPELRYFQLAVQHHLKT